MPSVSPSSCSTLLAPTASPASSSWGGGGVLVLPRRTSYRPCRGAPPDDPEPDRFGGRPEAVPGPPPDRPPGPRSAIAAPSTRSAGPTNDRDRDRSAAPCASTPVDLGRSRPARVRSRRTMACSLRPRPQPPLSRGQGRYRREVIASAARSNRADLIAVFPGVRLFMPKEEAMFRHLRPGLALLSATVALLVAAGTATALAPLGTLEYEPSYFEGTTVVL